MARKLVAAATLILFTFFSCQSYVTKVVKTEDIPSQARDRLSIKVLGVVTTANKWIEFETESGRIILNAIEGEVTDESGKGIKRISIPLSEVKRVWLKKFSLLKFLWTNLLVPAGAVFIFGTIMFIISTASSDSFCP
jgi:hypothetical protein